MLWGLYCGLLFRKPHMKPVYLHNMVQRLKYDNGESNGEEDVKMKAMQVLTWCSTLLFAFLIRSYHGLPSPMLSQIPTQLG